MATRNSRTAARVPVAALLLLPSLLVLATILSLASVARPGLATPSLQPAAPVPVATTDVEPGEVSMAAGIGMLLVTKASPSEAPPGIEKSVIVTPPLPVLLPIPPSGPSNGHNNEPPPRQA